LPQQVWDTSEVTPFTHLNPLADGVQHILPRILPPNSTDQNMTKTLLLLWYIWKARNDQCFQRKVWTSMQVHHAAQAHFNTNLTAWSDQNEAPISHISSTPSFHFSRL
jgi:hypothetical protein